VRFESAMAWPDRGPLGLRAGILLTTPARPTEITVAGNRTGVFRTPYYTIMLGPELRWSW
jgi:hypothetical protein